MCFVVMHSVRIHACNLYFVHVCYWYRFMNAALLFDDNSRSFFRLHHTMLIVFAFNKTSYIRCGDMVILVNLPDVVTINCNTRYFPFRNVKKILRRKLRLLDIINSTIRDNVSGFLLRHVYNKSMTLSRTISQPQLTR